VPQLDQAEHALLAASVVEISGPPPEVHREMVAVERAWQKLDAQGKAVRFGTGADGRVSVELTDSHGRALDVLGPLGLFRLLNLAG
jgi:hypothetical protein